ncbi:phosphatase PAP2 family protein [Acinetobacter tibetensis]|uniref:phosphatase PAP2 family protein n=1 Tax=Acinetobacter tibetensis TaxID=2943497 RepID=UPI003A4DFD55
MSELQRFSLKQGLILLGCFILLQFWFPIGGQLDLMLIQPWTGLHGQFPWRYDWFLEKLNHKYVKNLLILCDVSFLALWLASFKIERLHAQRWQYAYLFWILILSTSVVGILKSQSGHACPWNMTQATTTGFLWNFNLSHGHCFPGGHAATGFALMTGFFAFRKTTPKRAYFYLVAGLILGFAMGWAQMMRGAHFLSHNLWTAWVVWCCNVTLYPFFYRRLVPAQTLEVEQPIAITQQPTTENTQEAA